MYFYPEINNTSPLLVKQFEDLICKKFSPVSWHCVHIQYVFSVHHTFRADCYKPTAIYIFSFILDYRTFDYQNSSLIINLFPYPMLGSIGLPVPLPDLFLIVSCVMFQVNDILLCQPDILLTSFESLPHRPLFNDN